MGSLGEEGEGLAEKFLQRKGFVPLARRFKTPRWGEIDLIMRDGDTTVFVEVKTRSGVGGLFGGPLGAINRRKLKALRRASQYFLSSRGFDREAARIDAVTVVLGLDGSPDIRHYTDITSGVVK
jgi:putative endonuclease